MRRRLADERGVTLTEVMLVSILFVVILGATLTAVASFDRSVKTNEKLQAQAEDARRSLDMMGRQLRNLAKRINEPVILRATSDDFVFQTSDPTKTWVRWCMQAGAPGRPGTLYFNETPNAATVSGAMLGPCPGSGWTRATPMSESVVNAVGSRKVFSYACLPDKGTTCPASSADFPLIKSVNAQLFIDDDSAKRPKELLVSSTVYLRNQNEAPTALFTSRPSGTPLRVILNGAGSTDPEGRTLRYYWYKGSTAPAFTCDQPPAMTDGHLEGISPNYTFVGTDGPVGTTVPFTLVVCDPGDLQARYTTGVQIPA
jgi:type II secretory pathway pseudopilin PulG